jgi:hypothetical protein
MGVEVGLCAGVLQERLENAEFIARRPLDNTIMFAADGLRRHEVDSARIIDIDGSGAEVWFMRRDAQTSSERSPGSIGILPS